MLLLYGCPLLRECSVWGFLPSYTVCIKLFPGQHPQWQLQGLDRGTQGGIHSSFDAITLSLLYLIDQKGGNKGHSLFGFTYTTPTPEMYCKHCPSLWHNLPILTCLGLLLPSLVFTLHNPTVTMLYIRTPTPLRIFKLCI